MKKIKLFYNPFSGDKSYKYDLDATARILQEGGYELTLFRCGLNHTIEEDFNTNDNSIYDAFAVSGGDGSINRLVNCVINHRLNHIPIGIIPKGTANDFATYMSIPHDTEEAVKIIAEGNYKYTDVGQANNKYFINVCAAGLFSNISSQIDKSFKSTLGKLAYYIKGIEQIPNFQPFEVTIKTQDKTQKENLVLFLVLNSAGTGGLTNIVPGARTDDGYLDFIGFKSGMVFDYPRLLYKFFRGEHLDENTVVYFRENSIYIDAKTDSENKLTDIDGEMGPEMPIEIKNIHKAIKIFSKIKEG